MKASPRSPACDRKTDRYPLFQKAVGQQMANRSSPAECFPSHSQFFAELLTSAPIDFYLRTAEIRIKILHGLGRFLRLVPRRIGRLELHSDVRIPAVAQLVCKQSE